MSVNSNKKGGRVERQACKLLESFDERIESRRSQQYSGVREDDSSADILTNIECIRFEVKGGYNDIDIYNKVALEWINTAREETPKDKSWAILWKKDYRDWTIIFEIEGMVVKTHEVKKALAYLMRKHKFQLKDIV